MELTFKTPSPQFLENFRQLLPLPFLILLRYAQAKAASELRRIPLPAFIVVAVACINLTDQLFC